MPLITEFQLVQSATRCCCMEVAGGVEDPSRLSGDMSYSRGSQLGAICPLWRHLFIVTIWGWEVLLASSIITGQPYNRGDLIQMSGAPRWMKIDLENVRSLLCSSAVEAEPLTSKPVPGLRGKAPSSAVCVCVGGGGRGGKVGGGP